MRILIIFEEDDKEYSSWWLFDFPCRLFNEDMLWWKVFPKEIRDKYEAEADNPTVSCHTFDIDREGIFQRVWVEY